MIERWLTGWIDRLDLRFEVGEDELAAQLRPPRARRDDVPGRAVLLVWWMWSRADEWAA
jgi:hypothetical protein